MSRAFSSSTKAAKSLKWRLNGTTQPIGWAKEIIESVVDQIPELAEKVDSGVINGNPHSTGDDPLHASGVLGKKNMKGSHRATSFHAYPDGTVSFSDKNLPVVKVKASARPEGASSSSMCQPTETNTEPEWVWDEKEQQYRYWNGSEWVWQ